MIGLLKMVTVAVAFLLFLRCTLLGKVTGKSSALSDSNKSSEDVSDSATVAVQSPQPKAVVRKKMENGVFPGIPNGVPPSQTSMEQLMANRKEFLRASVGVNCNLSEVPAEDTPLSEKSETSSSRSLAECMSLLKAPVRSSSS